MDNIQKSDNDKWKYKAITPKGATVYFGSINKKHYCDRTPLRSYCYMDTYDSEAKHKFEKKVGEKRNRDGLLSSMNPERREYYELKYLN